MQGFKVHIKESNEARVKRAIEWFKHNAYPHETKKRITWRVSFDSHLAKEILVTYVEVEPEIPESTKRIATNNTIQRFCKYPSYRNASKPLHAYRKALGIELNAAKRDIRDYWIVSFLNLDRESARKIGDQEILGCKFHLSPWKGLSRFDMSTLWEQTKFQLPKSPLRKKISRRTTYTNKTDFSPVVSMHRTYDPGAAVNEAGRGLDLLRSAINLPRASSFRIKFRSRREALSNLCPSPIYGIFHEGGRFQTAYFTDSEYLYKRVRVSDLEVEYFKEIVEVLNSANSSTFCQHIVDAMNLYQSALDTPNPQQAFLMFWQTLEMASAPDQRNPKQDLIKSRITSLLDLPPEYSDALQMLMERRNLLVHTGSFPDREDDVLFALKPYADTTIWRLINLSKDFSSLLEFQEYLGHMSLSNKSLQLRHEVIGGLLEDRRDSQSG